MNFPTKQEEIEILRKIRVKISDPDATDSSSDDDADDDETQQRKRPKFIVHEIIQSLSPIKKPPLDFNQFSGKLPPMVRKRKSGKFGTEIRDPFSKKRIWLGTFNTAEEASDVYQAKKFEFQERLKKARNAITKKAISAKSELGSSSFSDPLLDDRSKKAINAKEKKTIFAKSEIGFSSPLMVDSSKVKNHLSFNQFSGKLPTMVRRTKSGKFSSEIKDPFSKKRIWLGTFNTAEEASMVYQSKKFEFQERLKKAKNAITKKVIIAKFELGSSSSDEPLKNAINAKVKKGIYAKPELGSSCSDPLLMVDEFDDQLKKAINANLAISAKCELGYSETLDSSKWVEEKDDEEMWMGQWIQISGDKEVKFSHKLGVPVVDNYGFLLGEFSKLDDLSISF